MDKLIGTLSGIGQLTGSLSGTGQIAGELTLPTVVGVDPYMGDYAITPRMFVQTLDTYGKQMTDDVTVNEIPVTRTSNPEGGQTVLIG